MNDETSGVPPDLPAPVSPEEPAQAPRPQIASALRPRAAPDARPRRDRGPRPELLAARHPVFREGGGFRLRLEPPDLSRLRELPGARGKTDEELGTEFLESHHGRLLAAIAGDVHPPAEIRVFVDPFSRQAFLALERQIKGIVSF